MVNRLLVLFAAGSALFLFSCASSKVVLNKNYQNAPYDNATLVVVLKSEPQVNYSGNVEPEFGPGDPNTLIRAFFKKQLAEDITSQTNIKNIVFEECTPKGYFNRQEVKPGDFSSEMEVLVDGGVFVCQNENPAYVLMLSDLYIGTYLETHYSPGVMGANGMMIGGTSSASKKLIYSGKAFLYDNKAKEFIEYGVIKEAASGFFPVITIGVWKSASSAFVRKLFEKTRL